MTIHIRPLTSADASFLREALYHAIYIPPGAPPAPRDIIDDPALVPYIAAFGSQPGDMGMIAFDGDLPVGAAWVRRMRGYGFVNAQTPELSIALLPGHRGQGIGTQLMGALLEALAPTTAQVSLSVTLENPAYRLYQRLGFSVVSSDGASAIMVYRVPKAQTPPPPPPPSGR